MVNFFFMFSIFFSICGFSQTIEDEMDDSISPYIFKHDPKLFVKKYDNFHKNFISFVGEKIYVKKFSLNSSNFDNCYIAKYRILEKVYGNFNSDTVEFIVYDHDGKPKFSWYNNVLLFLTSENGIYYHEKYMFNDVYMTKQGKWAGSYSDEDYRVLKHKKNKIHPIKIDFSADVKYPVYYIDENNSKTEIEYDKRYFERFNDSIVAKYGNYVKDLFILKRDGFLTNRNIFKHGKLTSPYSINK